jgi:RHS repeat-associated protein
MSKSLEKQFNHCWEIGRMKTVFRMSRMIVGAVLATVAATQAWALPSTKIGTAPLLTPTAADGYYGSATTSTNSTGASARQNEVKELARALKGDPDLIYEYVHNNVGMVWTYGLSKGAMGALIDRAGSSFDQADLMVQLLRESGFTASYKIGTITLSGAQFADWSGVTSATAACQMLSSGAIPAVINGSTSATCAYGSDTVTTIELGQSWVAVTIGGVEYVFDPSVKIHTFTAGLNLATVAGMTSGQIISDTSTYIGDLPVYAETYFNNLTTYIKNNLPAAGLREVVGGKVITPVIIPNGGLRQASLPYTSNVLRTITGAMPDQYRTSLQVQITKTRPDTSTPTIINKTLMVDDIYGRRLTFEPNFDTSGATFTSSLILTDDLGAVTTLASSSSYSDNPKFSKGAITLTANLPYAANSGAYMDATVSKNVTYALPFMVVHGWGETGRGLIEKWGQREDTPMPTQPDTGCTLCFPSQQGTKGDGVRELAGAVWLAQASRAADIHARIAKASYLQHYSIGISAADSYVYQTPNGSFWITDNYDRLDVETGFSLTSTSANADDRRAAVQAVAATISALKGATLAQVLNTPWSSSTASRFGWGAHPTDGEDGSGRPNRGFGQFATSTEAAGAMAWLRAEMNATEAETHTNTSITVGPTEKTARRQAVADSITSYVGDGFVVVSSDEAMLGPGGRAGALLPGSGSTYTHAYSSGRGGALAAVKYNTSGDPIEIANVIINPTGIVDGGGASAQLYLQTQYDPAVSADVLKARFIDGAVGDVSMTGPYKVIKSFGAFPYGITGELIWRNGDVRDHTSSVVEHRQPQTGWTTNWNNNLTFSGSGLLAMGEIDSRAFGYTVVNFAAAQDIYRSAQSTRRDATGVLMAGEWVKGIINNVMTVSIGASTVQYQKNRPESAPYWFLPGDNATVIKLGKTIYGGEIIGLYDGAPHPGSMCGWYSPSGSWANGEIVNITHRAQLDVMTFSAWGGADGTTCGYQRGSRLTEWKWPTGTSYVFNYSSMNKMSSISRPSGYGNLVQLSLTDSGLAGFTLPAGLGPAVAPLMIGTSGGMVTHANLAGETTKFDIGMVGTGNNRKYRINAVYAADDGAMPATQYVYDTLGRLSETKDKLALLGARGSTKLFLADGLRAETLDPTGRGSITYVEEGGRKLRAINAQGQAAVTRYDGMGRAISKVGVEGIETSFSYNAAGDNTGNVVTPIAGSAEVGQSLTTVKNWLPTGCTSVWWANPAFLQRLEYIIDPGGFKTTINVNCTTGQYTGTTSESVDGEQYRDNDWHVPTLYKAMGTLNNVVSYYENGAPFSFSNNLGWYGAVSYGGVGLASSSDREALTQATEWDNRSYPITVVGPLGAITKYKRDVAERVTLEWTGANNAKRYTYDLLGRVVKLERGTYPNEVFAPIETTTTEFDAVGNVTKITTPANVTQYSYDPLNRVVCTALRMNPTVYGNLPSDACASSEVGVDGPDRITRNTYDELGRVVQVESGVGSPQQQVTSRSTYSANGFLVGLTDANGNKTSYEYDGFGRLAKLRYPDPSRGAGASSVTDYEAYGYDPNGNVTSWRRRDGLTVGYVYDAARRMIKKDYPGTTVDDVYYGYIDGSHISTARFGSSTAAVNVGVVYDSSRNVIKEIGYDWSSTYDVLGQRTSSNGVTRSWNSSGNLASINRPGTISPSFAPITIGFGYGDLDRRTSVTRSNGVNSTYTYDAAGRLSSITHKGPSASSTFTQVFRYNAAGQVVDQKVTGGQYAWSGQPNSTTNYTADGLNRDTAIAAASGYDARGNLISDGTRTFTYDLENRLTGVSSGASSVSLTYDALGRLSATNAGGSTTTFKYTGRYLDAERYATTGYAGRNYLYGDGADEPILEINTLSSGDVDSFTTPIADRLGSIIGVANAQGAITPYTYGPYGEPQSWSGSRFRYTGQMVLPEAQLYHYKARVYDPMMGKFLQPDPIGYGDGLNVYAYVHGDPVNAKDPNGLWEDICVLTCEHNERGSWSVLERPANSSECPMGGCAKTIEGTRTPPPDNLLETLMSYVVPGYEAFRCSSSSCLTPDGNLNGSGWIALGGLLLVPEIKIGSKAIHLFTKAEHGLDDVLDAFNGNTAEATKGIWHAAQEAWSKGELEFQRILENKRYLYKGEVNAGGQRVTVEGTIDDYGNFDLGTAYIP